VNSQNFSHPLPPSEDTIAAEVTIGPSPSHLYSLNPVEGEFSELRLFTIHGSWGIETFAVCEWGEAAC
jgi:hypothetical protein